MVDSIEREKFRELWRVIAYNLVANLINNQNDNNTK